MKLAEAGNYAAIRAMGATEYDDGVARCVLLFPDMSHALILMFVELCAALAGGSRSCFKPFLRKKLGACPRSW